MAIQDLISDTVEGFSTLAARQDVELDGSVETDVPAVPVDVQKIERVLTNLVDNALRHTAAGGAVCVPALAPRGLSHLGTLTWSPPCHIL